MDLFDRNILINDDLRLFEHQFNGVTLLLGSDSKLLVDLRQRELYNNTRLIRQHDIVFLEAPLFLDELISHPCKFAILQFGRQVLLDAEIYLPMFSRPLDEVEFVLAGEKDEEIVGGLVVEVEDDSFFMLFVILGEDEPETALN